MVNDALLFEQCRGVPPVFLGHQFKFDAGFQICGAHGERGQSQNAEGRNGLRKWPLLAGILGNYSLGTNWQSSGALRNIVEARAPTVQFTFA